MNIAILLYPGFTALDAIGPYEVLSRLPGARVTFVGLKRGPVRTDSHMLAMGADRTLAEMPTPDMLLIPGGVIGTFAAARNSRILEWVKTAHATTRWTISVCSGALILGAAGLLQGLTATTHWGVRHRLTRYGATYVAERYVQHGKLITAAGVSAGIDMALFVAGEIAGSEEAKAIQLAIEYDPHPPFTAGSLASASSHTAARAMQKLQTEAIGEFRDLSIGMVRSLTGRAETWEEETSPEEA